MSRPRKASTFDFQLFFFIFPKKSSASLRYPECVKRMSPCRFTNKRRRDGGILKLAKDFHVRVRDKGKLDTIRFLKSLYCFLITDSDNANHFNILSKVRIFLSVLVNPVHGGSLLLAISGKTPKVFLPE